MPHRTAPSCRRRTRQGPPRRGTRPPIAPSRRAHSPSKHTAAPQCWHPMRAPSRPPPRKRASAGRSPPGGQTKQHTAHRPAASAPRGCASACARSRPIQSSSCPPPRCWPACAPTSQTRRRAPSLGARRARPAARPTVGARHSNTRLSSPPLATMPPSGEHRAALTESECPCSTTEPASPRLATAARPEAPNGNVRVNHSGIERDSLLQV